ncbi:endo alpha-1,4 polygalactosaminidase [Nocardia blacklockiae]|uniref:endo alpha-1,4 polygalactosaminidase n=1 Tax=Nocardia blacklockiae TaxID=480036 RepID=UPI002B4AECEA|nr:endo alpha-1,4 polygalactosaminidase [Nocardia blacklockiae]
MCAALTALVVVSAVLAACAADDDALTAPPGARPPPSGVRLPPAGAIADYQLGGPYSPPEEVAVVTRDSTAPPLPGRYNICYVNAFQTQPGERDRWLREHPELVLADDSGTPITDPGWPDELLLNTSGEPHRRAIADILSATIRRCRDTGYQAVEFDNLDSYDRSQGQLTSADNLALAALLATGAQGSGLAVAQKNSAELAETAAAAAGFDFVIAEDCFRYAECDSYRSVYGDLVLDIEYTDTLGLPFDRVCHDPDRAPSTILRDRALVPAGSPGHVYAHC